MRFMCCFTFSSPKPKQIMLLVEATVIKTPLSRAQEQQKHLRL